MAIILQVSVDEKKVIKAFMRSQGIKELVQLVRECAEEDAIPEGSPDATVESNRCYFALNGLDDLLLDLDKV